jgi:hypothetical protein
MNRPQAVKVMSEQDKARLHKRDRSGGFAYFNNRIFSKYSNNSYAVLETL